MRPWWTLALVAVLAGCNAPAAEAPEPPAPAAATWIALPPARQDVLADGPLAVATADYAFGNTTVGGPDAAHDGYEYEALVRGTLTMPEGRGPFPLAVFLHGQHTTCGGPDGEEGVDCDIPYRNDRGYVYLMEHLASHGIAVASILAHEINNRNGAGDIGMWARGELTLATIDALAASEHAARLDLTRIGLMGHSRGGEGVVTAVEVNAGRAQPWPLSAVLALAPTDFAFRSVPDVPFLTLAPYCDGDVYNLHGMRQFDQSRHGNGDAVKVQLLVMGANHNNYNTQWGKLDPTPTSLVDGGGDDAPFGRHASLHCDLGREDGGGRLTLEETYAESKLHLGGFLRWTLLGDATLAGHFLGEPQPAEACPAQAPCPGAVHVSTLTPGHRALVHVEEGGLVAAPGVAATVSADVATCQMSSCAGNVYSSAWMGDVRLLPVATPALTLRFDAPQDLRATPVLNVRVGVPTDGGINSFGPPAMAIAVEDASGAVVSVPVTHPALFQPPGNAVEPVVPMVSGAPGSGKVAANAVTLRLPDGIDAGNVTAFTVSFASAGPSGQLPDRILVADAWLNRDTASVRPPA